MSCEGRGPKDLQGGRPKDSTSHRGHGGTTTSFRETSGCLANLGLTKPRPPQQPASQCSAILGITQPQPPPELFCCSSHATDHVFGRCGSGGPVSEKPGFRWLPVCLTAFGKMGSGVPADTISDERFPQKADTMKDAEKQCQTCQAKTLDKQGMEEHVDQEALHRQEGQLMHTSGPPPQTRHKYNNINKHFRKSYMFKYFTNNSCTSGINIFVGDLVKFFCVERKQPEKSSR